MSVLARLFSFSGEAGSSSILPFIPRPLRFLLFLVLLLNCRSWPFSWHFRVFLPVIRLRLKWYALLLTFRGHAARLAWLDSLCPVGASPFAVRSATSNWVGIDDADYNVHLSNSSYAKALDVARLESALKLVPSFFRDGGWLALGATHFAFLREIPLGRSYEVRVYVGSWDEKWAYAIAKYVSKNPKAKSRSKPSRAGAEKRAIANGLAAVDDALGADSGGEDNAVPIPVLHTPATLALVDASTGGSPSETPAPGASAQTPPTPPAPEKVLEKESTWPEADDEVLHCVAVSEICFKIGRLTVPPALALASAGLGAAPPAEAKARWEMLRGLRHARHVRGEGEAGKGQGQTMRELLKGGWKSVPEGERWWDVALAPHEEDRVRRLKLVKGVREGLQGARAL